MYQRRPAWRNSRVDKSAYKGKCIRGYLRATSPEFRKCTPGRQPLVHGAWGREIMTSGTHVTGNLDNAFYNVSCACVRGSQLRSASLIPSACLPGHDGTRSYLAPQPSLSTAAGLPPLAVTAIPTLDNPLLLSVYCSSKCLKSDGAL